MRNSGLSSVRNFRESLKGNNISARGTFALAKVAAAVFTNLMNRACVPVKANGFLLILTLSFTALGISAQALDIDAEWQAATTAYADHNYEAARDIYEKLVAAVPEGQVPAADLCYNLGNVYYQLGQRGLAALMYEKALKTSPRHDDARKNLRLARIGTTLPKAEMFFLFEPLAALYERYTAGEWAILFTIVYLFSTLWGVGWTLAAKRSRLQRFARTLCIVSLSATVLVAAFLVPRYLDAKMHDYGVVMQSGLYVRSAPGDDEDKYFEAFEGERVEISEAHVSGWYRIKRPGSGLVGYLPETALRKI